MVREKSRHVYYCLVCNKEIIVEGSYYPRKCCGPKCQAIRLSKTKNARSLETLADRFWPKVDKTPGQGPEHTGNSCWAWTGRVDRKGYGTFNLFSRTIGAYRVSFFFANGYWAHDKGLLVRHLCFNPICVNPDHLVAGTVKENSRDRVIAGNVTPRTLTREQVREMVCLRLENPELYTYTMLSFIYGMSKTNVGGICLGKRLSDWTEDLLCSPSL